MHENLISLLENLLTMTLAAYDRMPLKLITFQWILLNDFVFFFQTHVPQAFKHEWLIEWCVLILACHQVHEQWLKGLSFRYNKIWQFIEEKIRIFNLNGQLTQMHINYGLKLLLIPRAIFCFSLFTAMRRRIHVNTI